MSQHYKVQPGYNDIGLCETPSIAPDILWCQLIPHCEPQLYTDMPRLTTGIPSEKGFVRRFRLCANVIDYTYPNLDSISYPTTHLGYMV